MSFSDSQRTAEAALVQPHFVRIRPAQFKEGTVQSVDKDGKIETKSRNLQEINFRPPSLEENTKQISQISQIYRHPSSKPPTVWGLFLWHGRRRLARCITAQHPARTIHHQAPSHYLHSNRTVKHMRDTIQLRSLETTCFDHKCND